MTRSSRSRLLGLGFGLGLGLVVAGVAELASAQAVGSPDAAALRVLDEELAAYNASDERAFLATLHFPHVRITGEQVQVFPTKESYLPELSLSQHGWDYARWTERRVVYSGIGKVHVVGRFTRYRADGTPVDDFEALFIIVQRNGRWGVLARSS